MKDTYSEAETYVIKNDSTIIPKVSENGDYQNFLIWVEKGGVPSVVELPAEENPEVRLIKARLGELDTSLPRSVEDLYDALKDLPGIEELASTKKKFKDKLKEKQDLRARLKEIE